MATATENLKVKITADATQAKAEISKFKDSLKGITQSGESATASINKMAKAVAALAVAFKALKAIIKNAIDVAAAGDSIKDNAQKVFMSTTAYQEWGYALQQNGIDIKSLSTSMRSFSKLVAGGSDVLRKYGITATDVDEAFEQAVYAIQNMETETQKLAAAQELFGTRSIELMPLLNMTNAETQGLMNTYRALGGTMSNELIAASDLCSDSILEMKTAWGGLRNLLATYVIPIVTRVVQWITLAIAKIRILLAAIFGVKETFGGGGSSKKSSIAGSTASIAGNTGKTAGNLKKAAKHAKELRRTLMGIDELTKLAEKATAAAAGGGGGGGGGVGAVDVGDIGAGMDEVFSSDTLDKIEAFRQKVDKIKDVLNGIWLIIKGIWEVLHGDFKGAFEDIWKGLTQIFPGLENLKKKWEDFKTSFHGKIISAKAVLEDKLTGAWNTIKGKWDAAKKYINGKVATAKVALSDGFSGVWKKIKSGWNSIKSKTATIKLAFVDKLKSGYNKIANAIQRTRNRYPATKIILPDIRPLAKGGVLTAPTTALMGEYPGARTNPEIATPQSLMYETIRNANGDLVTAFATMTRQVITAIEQKDMSVTIGDEQVARSAQRGNNAYYQRTGKALLQV